MTRNGRVTRKGRVTPKVAFLALGSTAPDALDRFDLALEALQDDTLFVIAAAPCVSGPYIDTEDDVASGGTTTARVAEVQVVNTVVQIATSLAPRELLARVLAEEARQGRVRDGRRERALDIDILVVEDQVVSDGDLVLPHPRMLGRAFVMAPFEVLAPLWCLPGTRGRVVEATSALRARAAEAFAALAHLRAPAMPTLRGPCTRLLDRAALSAWRDERPGTVGVVMTMGALHEGHVALVRRARAANDHVLVTLFVNPLQFGEGEDLARYPRTLEADEARLRAAGVEAVYVPAPEDLYPTDFSTVVEPAGPAEGFEGARRPTHFRGVATIVLKFWMRTRPSTAYFGRKDAQQVAVLTRMVRDLDLPGGLCVVPTVYDADGLALSSRNRYLDEPGREQALSLSRALHAMAGVAAQSASVSACERAGHQVLEDAGVEVEYLAVVDALSMRPAVTLATPCLAVGVIRVGETRLLDNRWLAFGGESAE